MQKKIYVASSWRNPRQGETVQLLRAADHRVYDFKNPEEGSVGFSWREVDGGWQSWSNKQFRDALKHPISVSGFMADWYAMLWADTCVLDLPCGRSAHLEAGYFVGAGKKLYILLGREPQEPELMYKMADALCLDHDELLENLRP